MRMVRSVDADTEASGVQVQSLASTTQNSWAEQKYDSNDMPSPDLGVERVGFVPVMVSSEIIDAEALSMLPLSSETPAAEPQDSEALQAENDLTEGSADPPSPTAPTKDLFERTNGAKVLVIGSSSIALNSSFTNSPANLNLLRNVIAWMAGEDAQLNQGADDDAVAAAYEVSFKHVAVR